MAMTTAEKHYTRIVKRHDKKLFVQEDKRLKILRVYRENYERQSYDLSGIVKDSYLSAYVPNHHYIMSLTDNWNETGRSVPWGYFPVLERLGEIDTWKADSIPNQMEKINEKVDLSERKSFVSKTEDFAYEFRDQFKKTFSDVNTASMEKIDKRRIKGE